MTLDVNQTADADAAFEPDPTHLNDSSGEQVRTRFRGDPRVVAVVTALTLIAYLPVLLGTYGIYDDYADLLMSSRDNQSLPNIAISGGRPVSGLVQEFALSLATDVGSLRWLRLVGVLGIAATAAVSSAIARSFGARRLVQVLVGLGVAAMPSSQVIASWAVLFPLSWGAAIALGAGFSLVALRVDNIRNRSWWFAVCAVAGVTVLGLANYQPSAMAFAPGLALALINSSESIRRRAFAAAAGVAGAAVGGAGYLIGSSALAKWRGVATDTRGSIELPDAGKLKWFVLQVAPRSLDPLSFSPRPVVVLVVAVLVLAGVASLAKTLSERMLIVALSLASVVAAYIPTLMVIDRWPSARSRLTVDITVALFAGIALHAAVVAARRRPPIDTCLLVAWTAAIASFLVYASWRVTTFYVDPQQIEYEVVSEAIRNLDLQPGATVVIVVADPSQIIAPAADLDEFGYLSMATTWGSFALLQLEVMDEGNPPLVDVTVVGDIPDIAASHVVILDIRALYEQLESR